MLKPYATVFNISDWKIRVGNTFLDRNLDNSD